MEQYRQVLRKEAEAAKKSRESNAKKMKELLGVSFVMNLTTWFQMSYFYLYPHPYHQINGHLIWTLSISRTSRGEKKQIRRCALLYFRCLSVKTCHILEILSTSRICSLMIFYFTFIKPCRMFLYTI